MLTAETVAEALPINAPGRGPAGEIVNKKNRDGDAEQISLGGMEEGEILARLSQRVEKAVSMIQELRRERDDLKTRLESAESQLRDATDTSSRLTSLEEEHDRFQRERGDIRERIESILSNLEVLDDSTADDEA